MVNQKEQIFGEELNRVKKIVDKNLHVDSAHKKAMKLKNILECKDND